MPAHYADPDDRLPDIVHAYAEDRAAAIRKQPLSNYHLNSQEIRIASAYARFDLDALEFVGLTRAEDVPFSKERAIDGDEVVKYEEIPVTINTLADFHKVVSWLKENNVNVALSSLMALHRMTVIAGYAGAGTVEQKRVYQIASEFLFGSLAYLDKAVATPAALDKPAK